MNCDPLTIQQQESNSAAHEKHIHVRTDDTARKVVVLQLSDDYLRTWEGILRFSQVVVSIVTLVCLFTSGKEFGGYLLLPGAGLLRPLVFTAVCALLTSLTHIVLHTTSILSLIPLDLLKLDMAVYSCLSALFLLSSLLILPVLAAVPPPLQWTRSQLWLTLAVSVLSALLHGVRVYTAYSAWRGCPARRLLSYQFRRRDNGEDAARLDPSST